VFKNRNAVLDCTVRALWEDGAEVQLSNSADVPEAVTLEISSSNSRWDGTVTIRRPNSLEIAFG
jgi:hypothetical protein